MTTVIEPRTTEQPLVRVERGTLADDELAALTAVLLTRATAGADAPEDRPTTPVVPLWDRPERHAPYRSPVSWQR
ncbi:acyl-CoA carboxylase subunit epsilon [Phaeacidiphilus oryzae]|uniref:acyl-CoA carboxylase subunit epsilon n=1 Tax=Phaeacidiphilus oryzae TaxID=348818 RepID=UPI000AB297FC|nr:acyl-CoA carboxylase subunit epsilon [Phaeacidiphilus oryzae]